MLVELKNYIQTGKALIGNETVIKALKNSKLKKIFVAKNCPERIKEDLIRYAKLSDVKVINLEENNEELGIICKMNYFISVVGV